MSGSVLNVLYVSFYTISQEAYEILLSWFYRWNQITERWNNLAETLGYLTLSLGCEYSEDSYLYFVHSLCWNSHNECVCITFITMKKMKGIFHLGKKIPIKEEIGCEHLAAIYLTWYIILNVRKLIPENLFYCVFKSITFESKFKFNYKILTQIIE